MFRFAHSCEAVDPFVVLYKLAYIAVVAFQTHDGTPTLGYLSINLPGWNLGYLLQ